MKPLDEKTQRALAQLAQLRAEAGPNEYVISDEEFLAAISTSNGKGKIMLGIQPPKNHPFIIPQERKH